MHAEAEGQPRTGSERPLPREVRARNKRLSEKLFDRFKGKRDYAGETVRFAETNPMDID
mgnify:CR=1 FL=1